MATATLASAATMTYTPAKTTGRMGRAWLFGPYVDLLCVANVLWPLLVFFLWLQVPQLTRMLTFWQVYLISTPHRWIKLALVYMDRDRFHERPRSFVGIGLAVTLGVLAFYFATGTLWLLLVADYLWNAWHFAAQHSGIARIYARSARPDEVRGALLEKFALRGFILFVIFRLAGLPLDGSENIPSTGCSLFLDQPRTLLECSILSAHREYVAFWARIAWIDWLALLLPAYLLVRDLNGARAADRGRIIYLTSVCGFYSALLLTMHYGLTSWNLALAFASSVFHALEYLAIVSWAVDKKHGRNEKSLFGRLVPRWGLTLVGFMCSLALIGAALNDFAMEVWLIATVIVSFLHYAYDGMIWKARRPASGK